MGSGVSDFRITLTGLLLAALLAGCGNAGEEDGSLDEPEAMEADTEYLQMRVSELEDEVAQKDAQLSEITDAISELETSSEALGSAVDDLESEAGSFQYDDWQNVVPRVMDEIRDVQEAAAAVKTETEALQSVAQ